MVNDLLVQLLDKWIANGNIPDEMSMEFGRSNEEGDNPITYFRWLDTNKEREFGYSEKQYNLVWNKFNSFWNSPEGVQLRKARVLRE